MQVKEVGPLSVRMRSLERKGRRGCILNGTGCEECQQTNVSVLKGYFVVLFFVGFLGGFWVFLVLLAVLLACFASSFMMNQDEFWRNVSQL